MAERSTIRMFELYDRIWTGGGRYEKFLRDTVPVLGVIQTYAYAELNRPFGKVSEPKLAPELKNVTERANSAPARVICEVFAESLSIPT